MVPRTIDSRRRQRSKRGHMCWYSWFILATLLQLNFVVVVVVVLADTNQELLEWVRAKGGYFNDKLELRSDENGLYGVFAAQDIRKNQVLASIPWNCILYSEHSYHRFQDCEVVRLLDEELNKEDPSFYAQGLQKTVREHASLLPVNWSKKGKELFLNVTGNGILPPEDPFMEDFEWKHECDKVSRDATMLVMTHGEDLGMVPLTDRFNNRGGNWTGAYFGETDEETGLLILALRNLKEGEQVYTDYRDYGQVGTPELLRDYGFVEMYPQRYILKEWEVAFDVRERDDGSLFVKWLPKVMKTRYYDPDEETAALLWQQVTRLRSVCSDLERISSEESESSLPENELQSLTQFCRDYLTALSLAAEDITECSAGGECADTMRQ